MAFEGDGRALHPLFRGKVRGGAQNGLMAPVHPVEKAQRDDTLLFHTVHSLHSKFTWQKIAGPPLSSVPLRPI